jgi:hypothetical protein
MPFIQLTNTENIIQNERYIFDTTLECHISGAIPGHISNYWWIPLNKRRLQ